MDTHILAQKEKRTTGYVCILLYVEDFITVSITNKDILPKISEQIKSSYYTLMILKYISGEILLIPVCIWKTLSSHIRSLGKGYEGSIGASIFQS